MSNRNLLLPRQAAPQAFQAFSDRLTRLERRSNWPGQVKFEFINSGVTAILELMTNSGYPNNLVETISFTLDPGRWILVFRTTLNIGASDGGECGMIGTATYDGTTKTAPAKGGGGDDLSAVGNGDYFTLNSAIEVIANGNVEVSMPVYWGYQPLVDPIPYAIAGFYNASITAFPG